MFSRGKCTKGNISVSGRDSQIQHCINLVDAVRLAEFLGAEFRVVAEVGQEGDVIGADCIRWLICHKF